MLILYSCKVEAEVGKVRAFFRNPENLLKITPLSFLMKIEPCVELKEGLRIKLKLAGWTFMESLIRNLSAEGFTDIAILKPPMIRHWEHQRRFVPVGTSTVIEDALNVETPIPEVLIKPVLRFMFIYRCRVIRRILK